jgi:hypothetical protein
MPVRRPKIGEIWKPRVGENYTPHTCALVQIHKSIMN